MPCFQVPLGTQLVRMKERISDLRQIIPSSELKRVRCVRAVANLFRIFQQQNNLFTKLSIHNTYSIFTFHRCMNLQMYIKTVHP
jgi:hypothetical protein